MNLHALTFWNSQSQQCNICGRTPFFWLPRGHRHPIIQKLNIIGAGRRFCDCPFCGSSDRDRLIGYFINKHPQQFNHKKILHIAPEKPIWKRWKKWGAIATGMDARATGYRFSYSKDVLNGNIEKIPFENETFDWVIANHVLEHVQHENIAFQELHRVLKARGSIIIQVPFTNHLEFTRSSEPNWTKEDCKEQLGQYDHQRLYGLDFMKKVTNFGFVYKPVQIKKSTALKYRINPHEKIFLFEKQNNHP